MDDLVKTVLIVLVILVLIYFLIKYFSKKAKKLTNLEDGTTTQFIKSEELPANNTSNFTYSIWFFVSDWNYKFGSEKTLMQAGIMTSENDESSALLNVGMGKTSNDLHIDLKVYATDADQGALAAVLNKERMSCPEICGKAGDGTCDEDGKSKGCFGDDNWAIQGPSGDPRCETLKRSAAEEAYGSGTWSGWEPSTLPDPMPVGNGVDDWIDKKSLTRIFGNVDKHSPAGTMSELNPYIVDCSDCPDPDKKSGNIDNLANMSETMPTTIKNFPLQKWVNLIISVYGRTLDIYIDGKLLKTTVLPAPAVEGSGSGIQLTPNGGFDGFTANLRYWADASNPQQAYNIYKSGYGGGAGSNVLDKYRLKVAYLEDGEEKGSFEI